MGIARRFDGERLQSILDDCLEVEFSFRDTRHIVSQLEALDGQRQAFILDWIRRVASTHIELAYQFALASQRVMALMDDSMIEAWLLQAMDLYDRAGLHAALKAMGEVESFLRHGRERAAGCLLEEQVGVLLPFVQGLSGRKLKLCRGDPLYTDTETIFLPAMMAHLPEKRDNFLLYKAAVAYHWAQVSFGTFQVDLLTHLASRRDSERALHCFHMLESERLGACIQRQLPGLGREMLWLAERLREKPIPSGWHELVVDLRRPGARARDSLKLCEVLLASGTPLPDGLPFEGRLRPARVAAVMRDRLPREKLQLRVALKAMVDEFGLEASPEAVPRDSGAPRFELFQEVTDSLQLELRIDGKPMSLADEARGTLTSILQDLGEVPPDYLVPAGPGEYPPAAVQRNTADPAEVWSGTYHEEGAYLYDEWDYRRKHYRKDWCVVREMHIKPLQDGFADGVRRKYARLLGNLRRSFEAMRDEERLLRRQLQGEGIDIDAFVESWADVHGGLEMSERLFTHMRRDERNIAVMFMVDMSGSTRGWVNQAEREALVLLAESLECLGDRYAIYGFTGMTRKRCEVFPVKRFEDVYDDAVEARIGGIQAGDYTRMGAAIRHLSHRLNRVEARTKLLITLSDGKPDDYQDDYRGEYGIEDTRQALFEARRSGIHAFCITIDETARSYLPHMYGAANYCVISEVEKLPPKVSEIYRKITR